MDAHEIIAQLKADPALLAEVRAVVLTDELLGVPERLGQLERSVAALVTSAAALGEVRGRSLGGPGPGCGRDVRAALHVRTVHGDDR